MSRESLLSLLPIRRNAQLQVSSETIRQLLDLFTEIADDRRRLQRNLEYALDTIKQLESQLAEYDLLLMQAQSQLPRRSKENLPTARGSGASTATSNTSIALQPLWIKDIWLCTADRSSVLLEAEKLWKHDRPQQALITATRALSSPSETVDLLDRLTCRLFIAAILHCNHKLEESDSELDAVFRTVGNTNVLEFPRHACAAAREVGAVARFIQGKNLMIRGEWQAAYWALTRALHTPGYHEKARLLQKEAIKHCARQGNASTTPNASCLRLTASSAHH